MNKTNKQDAVQGMSVNTRKRLATGLGATLGAVLLLSGSTVSAAAQFLPAGTLLAFTPGVMDPYGVPQSGSWWAFEAGPGFVLYSVMAPGSDGGVAIGVPQAASGSHAGCSLYGTEVAPIDAPWCFFGNLGMHFSFGSGVVQLPTDPAVMDMSGWAITWNGIPQVLVNEAPTGGPGRAVFDCATDCSRGDAFTLDYRGRVPLNDPSGFGGVPYILHLEGEIQTGAGRARITLENALNGEDCVEATGPAGALVNVNGLASTDSSGGTNLSYSWSTTGGVSGSGGAFAFELGVDGEEVVSLTTTDLATGDSSSGSLHVCVSDTTAPSVVITKPSDGTTILSSDFNLGVRIDDVVDRSISSYDVEVRMAATVSLDPATGESTVRLLKGGSGDEVAVMNVEVTASDASGNEASDRITVYKSHDSR